VVQTILFKHLAFLKEIKRIYVLRTRYYKNTINYSYNYNITCIGSCKNASQLLEWNKSQNYYVGNILIILRS